MPCPFPGMDPYIERPAIWGDFQWSMAVGISCLFNRVLRPKLVAMTNRLYVGSDDFQLEVFILEPAGDCRVVTAIEILTPENKRMGPPRTAYLASRNKHLAAQRNVVEIDLLRRGIASSLNQGSERSASASYSVVVQPASAERTPCTFPLWERLPTIMVPIAPDFSVPLDLQAVFTRCWDEGPYPELLHYDQPLRGEFTEEEQLWCREQLAKAGLRTVAK